MSKLKSTATASDSAAISAPPKAPAATAAAKPQVAATPAPATASTTVAASPSAVPLAAAPAASGCCQDVAADNAASATGSQAHACHGPADTLKSLVIDLESADAQRRLGAARALGRLKNRAAAAPLIAALSDPDADVANAAAHGLGVLGDPSAVEPLIVVLNNADGYFHEVVRTAGIASLGQLRDPRAVEPLQNAINDSMAETSAEAIHALAMLGDARGVASLLAVIRNADGFFLPTARRAAVVALAKLGGPQADCELKFVATNEFEDPAIRDAAIGVIAHAAPAASVN